MTIERMEARSSGEWESLSIPREHFHIAWRFVVALGFTSVYLTIALSLTSAVALSSTLALLTFPFLVAAIFAIAMIVIILRSYDAARSTLIQRAQQERFAKEHQRYLAEIACQQPRTSIQPLLVNGQPIEQFDQVFPTRADKAYFIDQCDFANGHGLTLANWLERDMPSGRHIGTVEDWHALLQPFIDAGAIAPLQERRRTQVLIRDAAHVRVLVQA